MPVVRRLLNRSPLFTGFVLMLALAARLAVPAGFMPVVGTHGATVSICAGSGPMAMAAAGAYLAQHGTADPTGRCAFADLALAALDGLGAVLLVGTPVSVTIPDNRVAIGFQTRAAPWLRPPLRGPPPRG